MKRLQIKPRPNWQAEVERLGLTFHTDLENDVVEQSPAGRIAGDVSRASESPRSPFGWPTPYAQQ
jgi:hypothetical protein